MDTLLINMSDTQDIPQDTDDERIAIREELQGLSFEQLQKLKEEMGTKLFNKKVFSGKHIDPKSKRKNLNFKRENKNRPREVSSKIPPRMVKKTAQPVIPVPKNIPRDPRFDSLCGTFKEKAFHSAYKFVDDIRDKEITILKKKLKKEKNSDEKEKIKYLVQRMENQSREAKLRREKHQQDKEEHTARIQALKHGEKPQFRKKSEQTMLNLVQKFETLKKTGKINKHIEKKTKQMKAKERKQHRYFE
uniref:rRNA biogenesis protein RRP36 n=1 Tax=Cacopsylla melanoneura TaxID=428564 RepID=A0A8D8SDU3_9HEMI